MSITTRLAGGLAISMLCSVFNTASAELFINPSAKSDIGKLQAMGLFGTSTITYQDEFGGKEDIDRTFLGASGAYGVNETVDVFASFALITDSQVQDVPGSGNGNAFALGARAVLPMQENVKLHSYVQYISIKEDYGSSVSGKETSLSAGMMAAKQVDNITLYGGPEIVFSSNGRIKTVFGTFDAERDKTLGLRGGAQFTTGGLDVNLGIALMHENTFTIGVGKSF